MKLYWVSLLIQDTENSKPWLSAMSSGCVNLEEAMATIERGRSTTLFVVIALRRSSYSISDSISGIK